MISSRTAFVIFIILTILPYFFIPHIVRHDKLKLKNQGITALKTILLAIVSIIMCCLAMWEFINPSTSKLNHQINYENRIIRRDNNICKHTHYKVIRDQFKQDVQQEKQQRRINERSKIDNTHFIQGL